MILRPNANAGLYIQYGDKQRLNMKFGKHPARLDGRNLMFADYVTAQLPSPPAAFDVLKTVYQKTKVADPAVLFPMDGNDTFGCCTIAALGHAITLYRGLVGQQRIMLRDAIVRLYFKLTGGQDSGLNMLDTLSYFRHNSIAGDQISAYVSINLLNHTHVKQAIQIFGAIYLGFIVQKDAIADFSAGIPWTPGPTLNEGHAIVLVGWDQRYVKLLTWGNVFLGTWEWLDSTADEGYALLPPEAAIAGFASGFDFEALRIDLKEVEN